MKNRYNVPPFDPNVYRKPITYTWWSWHPIYPNWSKSCWGSTDKQKALNRLDDPTCGLSLYHNKLIKDDNGVLEEIADAPCKLLDMWDLCMKKKHKTNIIHHDFTTR